MLVFIESIIKLLVNLLFADQLAKDNEKLRAEAQQLRQEKEESAQENQQLKREKEDWAKDKQQLEKRNQELIQSNFSLVKKYVALKQEKEELARKLEEYQSPRLDINQQFNPEDWSIIDQLLQEFNPSEELTI